VELLIEILSIQYYGKMGGWRAVFIIELFKVILKIFLLYKTKESILVHQKIPERGDAVSYVDPDLFTKSQIEELENRNREITKLYDEDKTDLDSDTRRRRRETILHPSISSDLQRLKYHPTIPEDHILVLLGEYMSILRPLIYLLALFLWGKKSWLPWLLSLAVDMMASTFTHAGVGKMNGLEKDEVSRRKMQWIYYLLRSPLFETLFVKFKLEKVVNVLKNIPVIRFPFSMCWEYILAYREYYFYTAGSDS